ncbi:synaptotagmin-10-like [Babylonia areolata]|uniref:synaptotagmin-10-like n=1 Tax=Babylonia areolata TaxID=304850 RepID=UPI003FD0045F
MGGGQSNHQQPPPEEQHLPQNDTKIQDITHILDVKAKSQHVLLRQKGIDWDQHEQDKMNVRVLKGLFKTLDPAVVREPGDSFGQLQLSLKYDTKRQLLLIKVIQCRNLSSRDVRTRASDPYVKVQMYPDSHKHGAKTTQIVVETRDPVFNEIFAFRASESELKEMRLVAQVWDYDVAEHDDFLGEVIIDIPALVFRQGAVHTEWFDLQMETDLSVSGELSATLTYKLPGTLYVTVHGAHGLSPRGATHTAHPFIKVALPGVGAVHCTQTQADTLAPEWQETFEFDISEEELGWRYVVFHVVDEGSVQTENQSMGQAILDLQVMTSQPSFHVTLPLADLRNSDQRLKKQFQQQVVTQELREACLAHTATRLPSFLFQQHPTSSSKRVKVSCRKAGRSSCMAGKMRIVDSVPVY